MTAAFFSEHVVNVWNSLPDTVDFSTLQSLDARSCVLTFRNSTDVSSVILFLLLYYYLNILDVMIRLPLCLPRWLSGLSHSAHRPERLAGGAGVQSPVDR